jgi:hypothetical protein
MLTLKVFMTVREDSVEQTDDSLYDRLSSQVASDTAGSGRTILTRTIETSDESASLRELLDV